MSFMLKVHLKCFRAFMNTYTCKIQVYSKGLMYLLHPRYSRYTDENLLSSL